MPELPPYAVFTGTNADYEPNPDPCCTKADASVYVTRKKTIKVLDQHRQAIELYSTNPEQASVDEASQHNILVANSNRQLEQT